MFIDDLDMVKEVLQKLNKTIGVYSLDYAGINTEHQPYFGNYFTFQCEAEKLLEFCKENNYSTTMKLPEYEEKPMIYTYINGNCYFALLD